MTGRLGTYQLIRMQRQLETVIGIACSEGVTVMGRVGQAQKKTTSRIRLARGEIG